MKKILTTFFAFFLINTSFSQCIEDVRALIDEFIEFQSLDFITSNGKGYVGRGYSSSGSHVYYYSVSTGLKTTSVSNGQPIAVSENGNYVLLVSGNWNRWETETGNILPMPFPPNLSGYNVVGVSNSGSVFANLVNSQNQGRGYIWTSSNGWQTAGAPALNLRAISNDGNTRVGLENNQPVIWKASSGVWESMEGFENVTVRINDISGNGLYTTGYFWDSQNDVFAFRWSNGSVEIMPGSDPDDEGLFVTDNGSILAYQRRPPGYTTKYVWWSGSSVTNFYDILIQSGLHPNLIPVIFDDLLPDGSDGTVTLISNDGFAIAGYEGSFTRVLRTTNDCTIGIAGKIYQYSVQGGNQLEIHWSASGINGDVTLEWSADGSSFMFIDNAPVMHLNGEHTGHGWYSWNIPNINTDSAYIRITAPGAEEILGPINITSSLSFIKPSAGNLFIAGETDTIKWAGVDSVNIYLSINYDNGSGEFTPIVENYFTDSGKYIWEIPDTILSRKCIIKIQDANDTSINVKSGVFRIKPYVITRIKSDSTYEAFLPSEDGWQMQNDTTDIWPNVWWSQFDYSGIDNITGNPYPSYFVNPPMSAVSKDFPDWQLFVEQFGVNQTYWINEGIPKSSAAIKWRNIKDVWGGSCYGFATSSLLAFAFKDEFLSRHPGIPNFTNLYDLFINTTSRKAINGYFTHQYGQADVENYLASRNKTPRQTLQELKDLFKMETPDSVKAISFFNVGGSGGHTVVPYKLERFGNLFQIYVYDSNNPGNDNAFLEIDSLNNTWDEYLGLNWPTGNNRFYLEIPAVKYFTSPVLGKLTAPSGSPFFEGTTLIGSDISNNISIVNSLGDSIGYSSGVSFNSIPGAIPVIPKIGRDHPPISYFVPNESYKLNLSHFDSSSAFISFIKDSTIYIYSREDAELNQTDQITLNNNLTLFSPDVSEKNLNLQVILDSFSSERVFVVKDLEAVQNDSINLSELNRENILLKNHGDEKNYELEIRYVSSLGNYKFSNSNINLAENSSHQIVPDWNDLQNQPVKILVDIGNDGTTDDTLSLKNEITGIKDGGSLLSPDNFHLAQNYPNPFNPVTTIQFSIPQRSNVTMKVYDILGNEVATLVNEEKDRGVYMVSFNASGLASGIYFYKLQAGSFVETKKMILIK